MSIVPDILSPATIIREAGRARLLTEEETKAILEMVKKRNLTSHIYQEEFAGILTVELPGYFSIMKTVLSKIA